MLTTFLQPAVISSIPIQCRITIVKVAEVVPLMKCAVLTLGEDIPLTSISSNSLVLRNPNKSNTSVQTEWTTPCLKEFFKDKEHVPSGHVTNLFRRRHSKIVPLNQLNQFSPVTHIYPSVLY